MGIPISIFACAIILAAAVMFVGRWEVVDLPGYNGVVRVDRWTGEMALCQPPATWQTGDQVSCAAARP